LFFGGYRIIFTWLNFIDVPKGPQRCREHADAVCESSASVDSSMVQPTEAELQVYLAGQVELRMGLAAVPNDDDDDLDELTNDSDSDSDDLDDYLIHCSWQLSNIDLLQYKDFFS
jgi:hypothetical protein